MGLGHLDLDLDLGSGQVCSFCQLLVTLLTCTRSRQSVLQYHNFVISSFRNEIYSASLLSMYTCFYLLVVFLLCRSCHWRDARLPVWKSWKVSFIPCPRVYSIVICLLDSHSWSLSLFLSALSRGWGYGSSYGSSYGYRPYSSGWSRGWGSGGGWGGGSSRRSSGSSSRTTSGAVLLPHFVNIPWPQLSIIKSTYMCNIIMQASYSCYYTCMTLLLSAAESMT